MLSAVFLAFFGAIVALTDDSVDLEGCAPALMSYESGLKLGECNGDGGQYFQQPACAVGSEILAMASPSPRHVTLPHARDYGDPLCSIAVPCSLEHCMLLCHCSIVEQRPAARR